MVFLKEYAISCLVVSALTLLHNLIFDSDFQVIFAGIMACFACALGILNFRGGR
jgi:hypothetical protein